MIKIIGCKGTVESVAIKEFLNSENKEDVIRKYENYVVATLLEHSYNLSKMISKLKEPYKKVTITKL